jgi:hypothetical protein
MSLGIFPSVSKLLSPSFRVGGGLKLRHQRSLARNFGPPGSSFPPQGSSGYPLAPAPQLLP